jgi:hypothetical protein
MRLTGRRLALARVAWLGVALPTLALAFVGLGAALAHPDIVGPAVVNRVFEQSGIPKNAGILLLLLPVLLAFAVTALVIFWRRSDDWRALFFALTLLTFGATSSRFLGVADAAHPSVHVPVLLIGDLAIVLQLLAIYLFPNARFEPRWAWIPAATALPLTYAFPEVSLLLFRLPEVPEGIPTLRVTLVGMAFGLITGLGLLSQLYRYREVSGPVERQQTKWVLFSLSTAFLVFVGIALPTLFWEPSDWFAWGMLSGTFPVVLFPVSVAMAVLRHRLWEVDLLISRTLIYGALTGTLALAYWISVIVLQQVLRPFTQGSELATIGSTVAVAVLFQPARRQFEQVVDRRFYRRKYDASRTLAVFGASLRNQVDLGPMRSELLNVVRSTMQPSHVTLWLRTPKDGAPA